MQKNSKNFMEWEKPGIALITGASSGIGAAFAKLLSSQGFDIILVARRKERLEKIAKENSDQYNNSSKVITADLANLSDIEQVAKYIFEKVKIDVLVNNAGFGTRGYFANIDFESQKNMIFVHNLAPTRFCRAALPQMIAKGRGAIINVASIAAFFYLPHDVMYCATKAFLKSFTESLHIELEGTGVKVQCLCPGFTKTEFHEVGDLMGFDRSLIPDKLWMTAEECVSFSLDAFRENKIVCIPGKQNEEFVRLWNDPKLGKKVRENFMKMFKTAREKVL